MAEREPLLIRKIVANGHELASHGYSHDKVHELTPKDFLENVRRTRLLLEDLGGVAVKVLSRAQLLDQRALPLGL